MLFSVAGVLPSVCYLRGTSVVRDVVYLGCVCLLAFVARQVGRFVHKNISWSYLLLRCAEALL